MTTNTNKWAKERTAFAAGKRIQVRAKRKRDEGWFEWETIADHSPPSWIMANDVQYRIHPDDDQPATLPPVSAGRTESAKFAQWAGDRFDGSNIWQKELFWECWQAALANHPQPEAGQVPTLHLLCHECSKAVEHGYTHRSINGKCTVCGIGVLTDRVITAPNSPASLPATVSREEVEKWAKEKAHFAKGGRIQRLSTSPDPHCEFGSPLNEWVDDSEPRWFSQSKFRIHPDDTKPEQPESWVPLESADIPPGSVFRRPTWALGVWEAPQYVDTNGVHLALRYEVLFSALLEEEWQIKRPGEQWMACRKRATLASS